MTAVILQLETEAKRSQKTQPSVQLADELRAGHRLLKSGARLLNQSGAWTLLANGQQIFYFHTLLF